MAWLGDEMSRSLYWKITLPFTLLVILGMAHHGQIWVRSEEDKGSVFGFSLPRDKHRMIADNASGESLSL